MEKCPLAYPILTIDQSCIGSLKQIYNSVENSRLIKDYEYCREVIGNKSSLLSSLYYSYLEYNILNDKGKLKNLIER